MTEQNSRAADSGKSVKKEVRRISERNAETEIFNKAFLKPIQVVLKTWKTEEDTRKQGSLPFGLKMVCKKDINLNQYVLEDIQPIREHERSNAIMYR